MHGAVLYAPGDIRVEELDDPKIIEPTDAILQLSATCVCGSDLWPYRGVEPVDRPSPMGHEYVGIVQEVGSQVSTIKPGQFVVGSFWASDNTCELCQAGYQSSCLQRVLMGTIGTQAELARVPLADGTLVATPDVPADDLVPSLLAASDVLGTGWFGAVAAEAGPGKTVAVVGDGAVGLLAVLAAKQLGAERIIAMSRHEPRQQLAREYGATDIVTERGDDGVAMIKDLTNGLGAHSVVEAVGTSESMLQAILDIGGLDPPGQTRLADAEVGGDLLQRLPGLTVPGNPDHVLAELLGIRLRHGAHPSSGTSRHHRSDVTYPCSSPMCLSSHLDLRSVWCGGLGHRW
jgi:threonine dehydrogenase-like Zn-dependent dehydrogenase